MFAVIIVVAFLGSIAGLLALMSRLEPVDVAAVATASRAVASGSDVVEHPRAA